MIPAIWIVLGATSAQADSLIYLDFSTFSIADFTQNGAVCTDEQLVEDLTTLQVARDFASFEVHVTRVQPEHGRYVHVMIGTMPDCDPDTTFGVTCDGDKWNTDMVTQAYVESDMYAAISNLQGSDGTCLRIATGLGETAAHETGHVMWLNHAHAWDDCPSDKETATDTNGTWHVMANSWVGLTYEMRVARDRLFSRNCESWVLGEELKDRGYYSPFLNATGTRSDLVGGWYATTTATKWWVRPSTGSAFDDIQIWADDIGGPEGYYLLGDADADGLADLYYGISGMDASQPARMYWRIYRSSGADYDFHRTLGYFGFVGDMFRVGDVDNNSRADLIRGEPDYTSDPNQPYLDWYVMRLFDGNLITGQFADNVGSTRDITIVADVDSDGADLVLGSTQDYQARLHRPYCDEPYCGIPDTITWTRHSSTGTSFDPARTMTTDGGYRTALFAWGDVDNDGDADLTYGTVPPSSTSAPVSPSWSYQINNNVGHTLGLPSTARSSSCLPGATFRAADVDADGDFDLACGEPYEFGGLMHWKILLGTSSTLGSPTTWATTNLDTSYY